MDIKQITLDLLATGLTQTKLASMVPCGQSTISALVIGTRGKRVSMHVGTRLSELHKKLCVNKKRREERLAKLKESN